MKFRQHAYLYLVIFIIGYTLTLIGNVTFFVFYVTIAFPFLLFSIFLLITDLIYTLSPLYIQELNKNSKIRFRIILLLALVFFLFVGKKFNQYYLPSKFSPVSLLSDLLIFLFTIFFTWTLLTHKKKWTFFVSIITAVMFVLAFVPMVYRKTRTENISKVEALKSLPYLSYVVEDEPIEKDGVITYNVSRSYKGVNIYNSHLSPGAYALDMYGNILHKWLPENSPSHWHYVEIYDEGDLLVIIKDSQIINLDFHSQIKWAVNARCHHDIAIDEKKNIYVLARKEEIIFKYGIPVVILNDYILILTPNGNIKREISLCSILKERISYYHIKNIYRSLISPSNLRRLIKNKMDFGFLLHEGSASDIFHSNTIEIIDRDFNDMFKKGNILFCARDLHLIGVIDLKEERLVWSSEFDSLEFPHHPTLLKNGNILIFDNGKIERNYSRVIELNPVTDEIVWQYPDQSLTSFYSLWGGANQRLPNGNTLITETTKGRVFEITREGEIVWEFYNPDKDENDKKATIYRMMRLTELPIKKWAEIIQKVHDI